MDVSTPNASSASEPQAILMNHSEGLRADEPGPSRAEDSLRVGLKLSGGQLRSLVREHGFESLRTEGQLPAGLRGTLVRNGPGLFESFDKRYPHLFEADGAPVAVRLSDSGATGAHKIVQSQELLQERRAGKPLFGSVASWPRRLKNGLSMTGKNTANTSVMSWQGRLFGLMEAAPPTELDPVTLETRGPTDLGRVIDGPFSAHPHRVVRRETTYNFGVSYGRLTTLNIYALPDTGPARRLTQLTLDKPVMLHDFIATEDHLIFLVAPAEVQVIRALLGVGGFTDLFRWRPEHGTEVIVVPIDAPERVIRFRTDAFYQWHFAGAYERGGELWLDVVAYPDFQSFTDLGAGEIGEPGRYQRVRIDPSARRLIREPLWDTPCEFPRIDPRFEGSAFKHALLLSLRGDQTAIARLDTETAKADEYVFPRGQSASEPVFVPRGASASECDGWALTLVYDAASDASHLAVLDTAALPAGPVYRAFFDHHIPVTFHGIWLPEAAS